jgi:asparagine synthase (glutamine-hydrolysing)
MCGIAGLNAPPGSVASDLDALLAGLRHRGPDAEGTWEGLGWHIGMRRLSIIDLAGGDQPMISQDGRWVLVLNGEIYNFGALRRAEEGRGFKFLTHSDTEVLLEAIAKDGFRKALDAIEGMFAIGAVDVHAGELWLARDRFGEKPLYVDRRGGGFAFCSELTPLNARGGLSRRPAARGLISILRYGYPWPGLTAFEGISELQPGCWLRRGSDGTEQAGRYWSPPDRVDDEAGPIDRAGAELLRLLDASVRDRLAADVPLGLFLSGGIDSGATAASAAISRPDIEAVSVRFGQSGYDESELASATAAHVGIRLTVESGDPEAFSIERFDRLLFHYGQPFYDTSAIPTNVVSRVARRHFKVVLSGDGGDELLAGYFADSRNLRIAQFARTVGASVLPWARVSMLGRAVLPERSAMSLALMRAVADNSVCHELCGVMDDTMVLELLSGTPWEVTGREHIRVARDEAREHYRQAKDATLAISLFQLRHSLPQDILTKVDRMSMAESLEVRAPFLDSRLAAYALALPAHLKVARGRGKYILRRALRGRLPERVLRAPKTGFGLPVVKWLGEGFWAALQDELQSYEADSAAELNVVALRRRIIADHETCHRRNDFRALHRCVLLYGFLRWRAQLVRPVAHTH